MQFSLVFARGGGGRAAAKLGAHAAVQLLISHPTSANTIVLYKFRSE